MNVSPAVDAANLALAARRDAAANSPVATLKLTRAQVDAAFAGKKGTIIEALADLGIEVTE